MVKVVFGEDPTVAKVVIPVDVLERIKKVAALLQPEESVSFHLPAVAEGRRPIFVEPEPIPRGPSVRVYLNDDEMHRLRRKAADANLRSPTEYVAELVARDLG